MPDTKSKHAHEKHITSTFTVQFLHVFNTVQTLPVSLAFSPRLVAFQRYAPMVAVTVSESHLCLVYLARKAWEEGLPALVP